MKFSAIIILMLAQLAWGQTNLISPTMTSASAPSPYVVSSSADYYSYQAWTMFDGGASYYWFLHSDYVYESMAGHWFKIYLGSEAKPVSLYQFSKNGTGAGSDMYASSFTLQGSNNGSDWTTIDSRTGISIDVNVLTSQVFVVPSSNVATYAYIKFTIDEINTTPYKNNFAMDDFKMWEIVIPPPPLPFCSKFASDSVSGESILSGGESGITVLK